MKTNQDSLATTYQEWLTFMDVLLPDATELDIPSRFITDANVEFSQEYLSASVLLALDRMMAR